MLEEAIDRLNPAGLKLGLVFSDIALSQELHEVGLIDEIKLKVFITTIHTALPAFSGSLCLFLMLLLSLHIVVVLCLLPGLIILLRLKVLLDELDLLHLSKPKPDK